MYPRLKPGKLVVATSFFKRRRLRPGQVVIVQHDGREKIKRIERIEDDKLFVMTFLTRENRLNLFPGFLINLLKSFLLVIKQIQNGDNTNLLSIQFIFHYTMMYNRLHQALIQ
jgi:hypothetical protein